ncbi:actin-binding LIM protein 3-like isoform X3 [Planococcus citri]|uniref:actin-binding LIM protein 3-like isoform X3 n=1 Tax=Planococcus citri TaxID=170843 RepID=UPI0031F9B669
MKSSSANGGGPVAAKSNMKFANGENSYVLHNGGEKIVDKPPMKASNGVTNPAKCPAPQTVNGVKNTPANDIDTKNATIKTDKRKIFTKGKTYCASCKKKCSGEVLRVQDKYFHIGCFKCKTCNNSLAQGGFFQKDNNYYCKDDYQRLFGTKCAVCQEFVEGEVVSALGNTYHQKCFKCARCRQPFPGGEKVTYTGKEVLCGRCSQIPTKDIDSHSQTSPTSVNGTLTDCAGCRDDLKEGQALIALDRQWHVWCFKCHTCNAVLHGEYMGKDGVPYCEKDYQKLFGVKCAYCTRFISGKVLQAGDNHHFHPTCARCTKCGDPFGDGEEMYLQGGAIWHPKCGPGPTENGTIINGLGSGSHLALNGHETDREFDHLSSSAVSETQHYPFRSSSPGLILREYNKPRYEDISRIYTYSYLTEEPSLGYLKRPIEPYDKPPTSPHFHRPTSASSIRGSSRSSTLKSAGGKSAMKVLVESIRSETPRPKSPHMNNEEPIELAHFPAAKPPPRGEKAKIERDDFPAPPYPYSDPERRKRWSDSYKEVSISDDEDEVDRVERKEDGQHRIKKEEEELSKIASGIGKVFLQNLKEREKLQKWKQSHIDPRNASRCPSASKEPAYRLRYQSPINASPSRNLDHPRPWEEEDPFERSYSCRGSSVGRSTGAISSYNVVSSLRHVPKPGYGLAPQYTNKLYGSVGATNISGDFSISGLGEKARSTDFSSGKSDISVGSLSEMDRGAMSAAEMAATKPPQYTSGVSLPFSPHLRRSLPNMSASVHTSLEPPKIYPYHLLMISNYRLPPGVDRLNLERHLSDAEFETLFQMSRTDFYRLPQWRRNELKRRARLF